MLERFRNSWSAALLCAAAACATSGPTQRDTESTASEESAPAPSPTPALPAMSTRDRVFKVLPFDGATSCDDVEDGLRTAAVRQGATPVYSRDLARPYPRAYFFPNSVRIDTMRRALTLDERGADGADAAVGLRFGTVDEVGNTTWDDSLTIAVPCTGQ